MKFLVDMNLSPSWVSFLLEAGLEAVHWSNVGPGDAEDHTVLSWAAENGRIVLTSDLDFGAILAAKRHPRPSVVQLRGGLLDPDAIGARVLAAVQTSRPQLEAGALISIDVARARLRLLPLVE